MKYFTLKQAEDLIPDFEKIFSDIAALADRAEAKAESAGRLEQSQAKAAELEIEKAQIRFLAAQIDALFQKIADTGALPKGYNPPLVDFPFRLGRKEVYLCWSGGEKKIGYYHGIEEGFAGRHPLPSGRPAPD
ncbi:MAG TPA: DUF2203 domain-containing protein [Elusimicrobiota bacterium]|nr:DUF2203 domain-containing protein [Elusimicrobiota bacterium]